MARTWIISHCCVLGTTGHSLNSKKHVYRFHSVQQCGTTHTHTHTLPFVKKRNKHSALHTDCVLLYTVVLCVITSPSEYICSHYIKKKRQQGHVEHEVWSVRNFVHFHFCSPWFVRLKWHVDQITTVSLSTAVFILFGGFYLGPNISGSFFSLSYISCLSLVYLLSIKGNNAWNWEKMVTTLIHNLCQKF